MDFTPGASAGIPWSGSWLTMPGTRAAGILLPPTSSISMFLWGFTVLAGGLEGQMYTRGLRNVYSGKSPGRQRSLPIVITTEHTSTTLQGEGVAIHSYFLPRAQPGGKAASHACGKGDSGLSGTLRSLSVQGSLYNRAHRHRSVGMAADGFVLLPTDVYKYQDLVIPGLFDRLVEGCLPTRLPIITGESASAWIWMRKTG